ncbi:MAG: aminoglycoside phosphotransferase family protein [Clostridiales bacterium]|nr:aminoglycoside phosphotransferase family protein [Clostridiales bacterium]
MDKETLKLIDEVIEKYDLKGEISGVEICLNGHINDTYHVKLDEGNERDVEYIFQRINGTVFEDPIKIMDNLKEITAHLDSKGLCSDCEILTFLDNKDGENYSFHGGNLWRVSYFVENSVAYEVADDLKILKSAGYAFGRFQHQLADFPMEKLHETIPDFHNTKKRLEHFFAMVEKDPLDRVKDIKEDIEFFREYRDLASKLTDMQEAGELPLRVVHNDTKYNNILMDKNTNEPLCVIDLDTVMPGLSAHDLGDAIRFAANTAVEDERDLSKVALDMEKYEAFTEGFIGAAKDFLTKAELETMALGAITITIELASRFLGDHINGDKYFRVLRENHNLDRARCQIRLAQDMLKKYEEMKKIVKKYS